MSWLSTLNLFRSQQSLPSLQELTPQTQQLDPAEEAYEAIDKSTTIATALENFDSAVQGVIDNETQLGVDQKNRPLVDVAMKVLTVICNSANNFCLKQKKWEELDKTLRGHLGNIFLLVDRLKSKTDLLNIDSEATRLMDQLPRDYQETRINRISTPYLLVLPNAKTAKVTLLGDFNQTETLVLNDRRSFKATQAQQNRLEFDLDASSLVPQDNSKKGVYRYVSLSLKASIASGFPLWKTAHFAMHHFWVGLLPNSPGRIEVSYKALEAGKITRYRHSDIKWLPRAFQPMTFTHVPSTGWKFSESPYPEFEEGSKEFDIDRKITSNGNDSYTITLEDSAQRKVGRNRAAFFRVRHIEYKNVQAGEERVEVIENLPWDTLKMVTPALNEKVVRIVLRAFNGQTFTFLPRTTVSHPFLKVYNHTGDIIFEAPSANSTNPNFVNLLQPPSYDQGQEGSFSDFLNKALAVSIFARVKELEAFKKLLELETANNKALEQMREERTSPLDELKQEAFRQMRDEKEALKKRKTAIQEELVKSNQRERELFNGFRETMQGHFNLPGDLFDQLESREAAKKDEENKVEYREVKE
jgi:hypothetical protein